MFLLVPIHPYLYAHNHRTYSRIYRTVFRDLPPRPFRTYRVSPVLVISQVPLRYRYLACYRLCVQSHQWRRLSSPPIVTYFLQTFTSDVMLDNDWLAHFKPVLAAISATFCLAENHLPLVGCWSAVPVRHDAVTDHRVPVSDRGARDASLQHLSSGSRAAQPDVPVWHAIARGPLQPRRALCSTGAGRWRPLSRSWLQNASGPKNRPPPRFSPSGRVFQVSSIQFLDISPPIR